LCFRQIFIVDGWTTDLLNCSIDLSVCTPNYIPLPFIENTIFGVTVTSAGTIVSTFKNLTLYPTDGATVNESIVFSTKDEKAFYMLTNDRRTQPAGIC